MRSLYRERRTWLHAAPAWLKLTGLSAAGTLLFAVGSVAWLAAMFAAAAVSYASLRPGWRGLRGLTVVLALIVAFHIALGTGPAGLLAALRLAALALLGLALTLTTRSDEMLAVAETLLAPSRRLGLRPDRLALAFALMLRFTEVFFLQWQRLDEAHRARSFRPGGWRLLAPLVLQVFASAERVADALAARLGG